VQIVLLQYLNKVALILSKSLPTYIDFIGIKWFEFHFQVCANIPTRQCHSSPIEICKEVPTQICNDVAQEVCLPVPGKKVPFASILLFWSNDHLALINN
jgi:hypothetical protein